MKPFRVGSILLIDLRKMLGEKPILRGCFVEKDWQMGEESML